THAIGALSYVIASPSIGSDFSTTRTNDHLAQLAIDANRFWPRGNGDRVFLVANGGTSFDNHPLPTEQFELGRPFRLGAYDEGAVRGDHYGVLTGGYLKRVGRLPDFIGGPAYFGGWVEAGSAFDTFDAMRGRADLGLGGIFNTIVGPGVLAGSVAADGNWRIYVRIGRLF
ncbi:MAG TPA: hypothetical protein VGM50_09015, partial [Gemmatimonadaceae bacterium]